MAVLAAVLDTTETVLLIWNTLHEKCLKGKEGTTASGPASFTV